jgi:fructose-1-phosphate kinase PfkB-like protein
MAAGGSAVAGLATNSARRPDTPETLAAGIAAAAANMTPLDGTTALELRW